MKSLILLLTISLYLSNSMRAQDPTFEWATSIGSTEYDISWSITTDASGNVYTTGEFRDTADLDHGPGINNIISNGARDIFIQKLDANGNLIWAKGIGSIGDEIGRSITTDALGNVYVTGIFTGSPVDFDPGPGTKWLYSNGGYDAFILKLDSNGNFVWAKSIGSTLSQFGNSITTDALGNVYTTGIFNNTVDFDPGPGTFNLTAAGVHTFIQKLDANGDFIWAIDMGLYDIITNIYDRPSIAIDPSGNIYTTGHFEDTVDLDPGPGVSNFISKGFYDIFIQKLDTDGNFLWAKQMGGSNSDVGRSITTDASGNVYTTGYFHYTVDFDPGVGTFNLTTAGSNHNSDIFIQKLDANGNFIWAKNLGSTSSDIGFSITTDASENVYTTGYFMQTTDFDPGPGVSNLISSGNQDIFIQKLDANGDFIWAKGMGSIGLDYGYSIITDASGNVYTTGHFTTTTDFDPGPGTFNLTSNGTWDCFILKLSQCTPSVGTETATVCDTYTAPDGAVYTSTGMYTAIVPNSAGCDSIITIDLTVNYATASSISETSLDSYTAPSGAVYTTSGVFNDTIVNAAGCDSVLTITLTMNYTGIEELNDQQILITPNPTSDFITIRGIENVTEIKSMELVSSAGMVIAVSKVSTTKIDVSTLRSGTYFLSITHAKGTERLRFVKE